MVASDMSDERCTHVYVSIYKRGGPGLILVAFSAPPAWVPGAKMFFKASWSALLFYHRFQSLSNSLPGVLEAPFWLPLGGKNEDSGREGYKK